MSLYTENVGIGKWQRGKLRQVPRLTMGQGGMDLHRARFMQLLPDSGGSVSVEL